MGLEMVAVSTTWDRSMLPREISVKPFSSSSEPTTVMVLGEISHLACSAVAPPPDSRLTVSFTFLTTPTVMVT